MSAIDYLNINGSERASKTSHTQKLSCQADRQPGSRQRRLLPRAQTFRVLVLAAEVHSEDEGLEDEGHDDGHHHLAGTGRGRKRMGGALLWPPQQSRADASWPCPPRAAAQWAGQLETRMMEDAHPGPDLPWSQCRRS